MPDTPLTDAIADWAGVEVRAGSPTMPDTLTPERIAEIREDLRVDNLFCGACDNDKIAAELLAHIDALTAAVEGLDTYSTSEDTYVPLDAVLAILRGEQ